MVETVQPGHGVAATTTSSPPLPVNVIRIIPPLVTTADEVALALSILDESLAAAGA